jgi:hypothetical protein
MERFNNLSAIFSLLYRRRVFLSVLLLSCIFLYGCFRLRSLEHPATAETNSYFDVTFVCEHTNPVKTEGRGYFGALLPKGWRAQDYTGYVVHFPDPNDDINGRLAFDQYYTDALNASIPAPAGYYWWGGRSIDQLELKKNKPDGEVGSDDFTFTFRIFTDNQTGDFNLRYVVGTDGNGENPVSNGKYIDETRTINITQGSEYPMQKIPDWELLQNREDMDENVKVYSDKDYNGFFTRWHGWTGGDIGRSAPLGDGRSIWVWGDSHTGTVLSDRSRVGSGDNQFERNFLILQDGEDFSAFRLLNEGTPGGNPPVKEVLIPTDDNGNLLNKNSEWYWPSGSQVYYRNGVPELQMVASRTRNDGSGGMWGMEGVSADVAVFSLPDLKLKEIKKHKHMTRNLMKGDSRYGLDFGGYVFKDDDGTVYIYGYCDIEGICTRYGLVARVTDGDLTGDWEFYNAGTQEWSTDTSWQDDIASWEGATVVPDPVFVFKDAGKYYGITQPGRCFSEDIVLYEADTPYGPFRNRKIIAKLPVEITESPYICSLLAFHPQYSKNGEIFFSVSKNFNNDAIPWYNNPGAADSYLPYFFRVEDWRNKLSIYEGKDVTDNKGILTAQYGEEDAKKLRYLTDNNEKTVYSAPAGSAWIEYESPSPVRLNRYTITSAPDSPDKDPYHWKVLGSNDGSNWTVLDERYYIEFKDRWQTANYTVPVFNEEYTHFRLEILATKGGAGLQIADWQMFGKFDYEVGSEARLEEVLINGEPVPVEDVMNITVLPTEGSKFEVELSAFDYGAITGVDRTFTVNMDNPGIQIFNIKVTSEDGNSEKDYKLVFNRWFAFNDLIKVKWNNTLMLYLNKLKGYDITGYQWYQDESPITGATGTSYSAGTKINDLLNQTSAYHVVLRTPDGNLRSEAEQITLKSMNVLAYPNPVNSGGPVTVDADLDEDLLLNSTIEVYDIQGNKFNTVKVSGRSTTVNMPSASGTYMIRFKAKNDIEKTLKIIVK